MIHYDTLSNTCLSFYFLLVVRPYNDYEYIIKVFKCHSIADMNEISIIKHVNGHSYIFILFY